MTINDLKEMNEDIWLKENKTGEDLLLCLQNCIEEEHWFEIDERDSKVLFNYITNLKQALIYIREYIHSEEFFMLMNSGSIIDCPPDKPVGKDYFEAQSKLDQIINKTIGGSN